jgi:hypothetical protein
MHMRKAHQHTHMHTNTPHTYTHTHIFPTQNTCNISYMHHFSTNRIPKHNSSIKIPILVQDKPCGEILDKIMFTSLRYNTSNRPQTQQCPRRHRRTLRLDVLACSVQKTIQGCSGVTRVHQPCQLMAGSRLSAGRQQQTSNTWCLK